MISTRPLILIKVTFQKHFALEVWVSIFEGSHRWEFLNYDVFLVLTFLTSAKSVNPDEVPLSVGYHIGHHCLQKCPFRGLQYTKG